MNYTEFKKRSSECHTGEVNDSKEMSTVSYIKMQFTFNWMINVFRNVEIKYNT